MILHYPFFQIRSSLQHFIEVAFYACKAYTFRNFLNSTMKHCYSPKYVILVDFLFEMRQRGNSGVQDSIRLQRFEQTRLQFFRQTSTDFKNSKRIKESLTDFKDFRRLKEKLTEFNKLQKNSQTSTDFTEFNRVQGLH